MNIERGQEEISIEGEPWLDQEREKAYSKQIKDFSQEVLGEDQQEVIRSWFSKIFGIDAKDLSSFTYLQIESKSSSEIAGREIVRPFFLFSKTSEFQKFTKKISGHMDSRGMVIPGDIFPEKSGFYTTGMLVVTNDKEAMSHEIRHSIDPYLDQRKGENIILSELFGFYQKCILEDIDPKDEEDKRWKLLEERINARVYYETIKDEFDGSYEEFKQKVKESVYIVKSLTEKLGHIETQRAIIKSKTIQELIELSKP